MGIEGIPDQMLACQVIEFKKPYKIHNVPTPQALAPNDLLVKVAVASLCHTDGMVSDGIMGTKLPCTASHEGTGSIAAMGSAVKTFQKGERVMCGLFRNMCGVCADCQGPENFRQYCSYNDGAIGVHTDGAFADYVVIDSRAAVKLPDSVSFATAAPMACAGCTIWRGVLQSKLQKGEWLCIVGSGGGLGHLGIQFAKALGLNVIGVDARDEGLALSKEVGADILVDARKGDDHVIEEIGKVTGGNGADATVNVSDAKSAAGTACRATKKHGLMIQIAQPTTVDIPFEQLVFRDIRVHGSLISSTEEAKKMIEVVAEHNISVKTNQFSGIKKIPELLELAHSGKMQGKAVCIIDEEQVKKERENAPGGKLV